MVLPIGGHHVTNDITPACAPFGDAERIKQRFGWLKTRWCGNERVEVPSAAGKSAGSVSRQILCEIIEPRLDEVFQLVRKEIEKSGYEESLPSGVVMTGGSMLLPGAVEMAEEIFGMPVRLGTPMHIRGLVDVISSPVYAAGTGLVLYGMQRQERNFSHSRRIYCQVKHRMSDWWAIFVTDFKLF